MATLCSSAFSLFHCATGNETTVRCCMGFLCVCCSSSEVLLIFCSVCCHCVADLQQRQLIRDSCSDFQVSSGSFRENLLGAPASGNFCGLLLQVGASLWRHCLCQLLQMTFVVCLLVVDYLCVLSSADC